MDGINLEGLVQDERDNHRFFAWSPGPETAPRQHGFVLALLRLAMDVAREPGAVEYLERILGYVDASLPVKVLTSHEAGIPAHRARASRARRLPRLPAEDAPERGRVGVTHTRRDVLDRVPRRLEQVHCLGDP